MQTLKEKLNIVDVINGYVTVERRGANWWACCPFHHEKTPSFSINEPDQYYHCFGCGESGDVVKFVQEMENVEFMEAVRMLADRAGMQVPNSGFDNQKTVELKRKKDVLLKIMNDCAHFYLDNLNSGKADAHIEYILKRKIPSSVVRKFGLGASLNYDDLPRFLLSKGYLEQDMIDSGAVNKFENRLVDAQGGRLIYPVINAMDEVVAFGGRILKAKADFAKYKNTKETLLFNKSKTLYNINLLKKLRKSQTISEVIMVEGYMDTISLYQAGFKNVVASMGTSLTQEQARLVKRYADTVLISYDGDAAGQKANMRGLEILKSEGINVKVVPLPEGLDPDDVIKQRGAEGYAACLESAMPLVDYKLTVAARGYDLKKTEDKRNYVADAIKVIRTADSAAEQEELLKQLHDKTGITFEALKRDLQSFQKQEKQPEKPKPVKKDASSVYDKASRFVIAAYLFGAKFKDGPSIKEIPFENDVHKVIARYIISKNILEERVRPAELFEIFEENSEEYAELCRILDYNEGETLSGETAAKYFADCLKKIKLNDIDKKIKSITLKTEKAVDVQERTKLAETLQNLLKLREKIKSGDKT